MGFAYVFVADAHSTVAEACIDRLHIITQFEIFGRVKQSWREVYIVAPDAGATKKCEAFAKLVGAAGVITCAKDRVNGKVQGIKVLDTVPKGAKLFVLDDLCDGGRTFIEVAKELETITLGYGDLELAITHGLFTKGVDIVAVHYDKIYTTDSYISDKSNRNGQIEVIELK
jgi:ribose-phosphate pyrophosphokinase